MHQFRKSFELSFEGRGGVISTRTRIQDGHSPRGCAGGALPEKELFLPLPASLTRSSPQYPPAKEC